MINQPKDKFLCILEKGQRSSKRLPQNIVVVEVGRDIILSPVVLDKLAQDGFQRSHYDLLVLCAAIELADRRWERPQDWHRIFRITVPVLDLATWKRNKLQTDLEELLSFLTGDTWHFDFKQAINDTPVPFRQLHLDLHKSKRFIVAYSDGLDSRAASGLCGDESMVLRLRVAKHTQKRKEGESYFLEVPFEVNFPKGRCRESSFRTRGFKFAAISAIASHITKVKNIVVPESGQGALSPVLVPLHKTYADYRNHPLLFKKMKQFIQELLNYEVHYDQPHLWSTKGQTIRKYLEQGDNNKDEIVATRSCWQSRPVVNEDGVKKQCGLCAACLLRRICLHAAGIEEDIAATYIVKKLNAADSNEALASMPEEPRQNRFTMLNYGCVGVRHWQKLADLAHASDETLSPHAARIAEAREEDLGETLTNLRAMLTAHDLEWRAFLSAQGANSFLKEWIDGEDP